MKNPTVGRKRRKVGLSLLALTLAASSVSGFTCGNPTTRSCCWLASAHKDESQRRNPFRPQRFASSSSSSLASTKTATPHAPVVVVDLCGTGEPANKRTPTQRRRLSAWKRRTRQAVSKLFPSRASSATADPTEDELYEQRKQEWAARYTHVDALREHFGANKNRLWGDLDATTSRRLYKTLLPRALLELYRLGVKPQDLAPLAYQARVAAKLYARERCVVPARLAAHGYDGFRQWRQYGEFQPRGMSYDQIWEKYKSAILQEADENDLKDEDVTARICLKILERSCQTNERIDRWFLGGQYPTANSSSSTTTTTTTTATTTRTTASAALVEQARDLATITEQLEREVFDVLEGHRRDASVRRASTLRLLVRAKRRLERLHPQPLPAATEMLKKDIQLKMHKLQQQDQRVQQKRQTKRNKNKKKERKDLSEHHP